MSDNQSENSQNWQINNKYRQISWKKVAEEKQSELDAAKKDIYYLREAIHNLENEVEYLRYHIGGQ